MNTRSLGTEAPRLCIVGSSNIDLTFRSDRLPRAGETISGTGFHLGFGGKGANQAVMAARLGARVTLISRVGQDGFGEGALRHFQEQGMDTSNVSRDETLPSGTAAILVDAAAQNRIIVVAGANAALSPRDVHRAAAAIQSSQLLLGQLEVPLETTLAAFQAAKAAGVPTMLNPAPAVPLPDELLRLTDTCVPNETEIESLTGQPAATLAEAEAAARTLLERGPGRVVVTLGVQGALLVEPGRVEHVPAFAVPAVDTTGAGDAFIGSLAVFLGKGWTWLEAMSWANAAAALSVTRPGAQASFPNRAEVEAFLSNQSPASIRQ